ncbi:transposase [bacterium]|nr:transposase [bacterium]MBU1072782.1 transposase [bacterium]MBU1676036.1 transposase [bacterium]
MESDRDTLRPRLLDRIRHTIRTRHYSRRTERAYVDWVRRFVRFHGLRHPEEMGAEEVTAFLTHLAVRRRVSASTQNQALSALLFLYRHVLEIELPWLDGLVRAKRPQRLPTVLSKAEVGLLLGQLHGPPRLVAALLYGLLFRAVSQTLAAIARDPRHLGAEIGFLAVLHTWGQNLHHHPHVHCVVPGGGLSLDGQQWVASRKRYFLPVPVLRRFFRGCFLRFLQQARQQQKLEFHGEQAALAEPERWQSLLATLRAKPWVVYAKPLFGGPRQVLRYLARYTHRVAISNRRILSIDNATVRFQWKDYRHDNQQRVMTLAADEFIRRFLLHVLPKGFQRIRQYGLLANRAKTEKLARCRRLLAGRDSQGEACGNGAVQDGNLDTARWTRCPVCRQGRLLRVGDIAAVVTARSPPCSVARNKSHRRAA